MALNSEHPKHEEGTSSGEGRVPGRVGGERKIIFTRAPLNIVLM
jgi:hypothetical protein